MSFRRMCLISATFMTRQLEGTRPSILKYFLAESVRENISLFRIISYFDETSSIFNRRHRHRVGLMTIEGFHYFHIAIALLSDVVSPISSISINGEVIVFNIGHWGNGFSLRRRAKMVIWWDDDAHACSFNIRRRIGPWRRLSKALVSDEYRILTPNAWACHYVDRLGSINYVWNWHL